MQEIALAFALRFRTQSPASEPEAYLSFHVDSAGDDDDAGRRLLHNHDALMDLLARLADEVEAEQADLERNLGVGARVAREGATLVPAAPLHTTLAAGARDQALLDALGLEAAKVDLLARAPCGPPRPHPV